MGSAFIASSIVARAAPTSTLAHAALACMPLPKERIHMHYVDFRAPLKSVLRIFLIALLAGGVLLVHTPLARATTLIVTRPDDPAPNGCAPDDCSLREAIIAANAAAGA